jgi:hypothetical protein
MKSSLHVIALVLFAICFLYDLVVWGAVSQLPDVGTGISDSARREAPLATTYIMLGSVIDSAVPSLGRFGSDRLTDAFSEGFERIRADPTVAMDLIFGTTWNGAHSWVKSMYWAAPILFVVTAILWLRKPRQVRTLKR